jgi:hypothetical protein
MPTQMPRVERGYGLSDSELAKVSWPGGRMSVAGSKSDPRGEAAGTVISDGSPAAVAAAQERHDVRHKPALAAQRMRGGK